MRLDLATLCRQAITLRRYLAPQRDVFAKLVTEKIAWLDDESRIRVWEVSDRLIRNIEYLDAVHERAAVTREELPSRLSDQMNTRMYVLSIVAAIFLPLASLTGLLGINVGGIPGAELPGHSCFFYCFLSELLPCRCCGSNTRNGSRRGIRIMNRPRAG